MALDPPPQEIDAADRRDLSRNVSLETPPPPADDYDLKAGRRDLLTKMQLRLPSSGDRYFVPAKVFSRWRPAATTHGLGWEATVTAREEHSVFLRCDGDKRPSRLLITAMQTRCTFLSSMTIDVSDQSSRRCTLLSSSQADGVPLSMNGRLPIKKGRLPPGWWRQRRVGRAREYSVFYGPGKSYAESVPGAWREFGKRQGTGRNAMPQSVVMTAGGPSALERVGYVVLSGVLSEGLTATQRCSFTASAHWHVVRDGDRPDGTAFSGLRHSLPVHLPFHRAEILASLDQHGLLQGRQIAEWEGEDASGRPSDDMYVSGLTLLRSDPGAPDQHAHGDRGVLGDFDGEGFARVPLSILAALEPGTSMVIRPIGSTEFLRVDIPTRGMIVFRGDVCHFGVGLPRAAAGPILLEVPPTIQRSQAVAWCVVRFRHGR